ncbi:GNAT family N-acetyltransferase [Marininema halotolerans]|uniref:Protein N-acetyltransferase, RimJ/RimL family n=1 Tax=Marininema halotolerans TaxID=1155944 RepID=A0A1I6THZ0_9BACL|nr:GNAT family N-acetyltransferase [Marininema halotolerans]SFS88776.1 Protein N-acetyltransferase, RimJ/RimL family [Marininema halotolerans]
MKPSYDSTIQLRDVKEKDLPTFFKHQQSNAANKMAAFTVRDPNNWKSFFEHWTNILTDASIIKKAILYEEELVGHLTQFNQLGHPSISYWIGEAFWGRGIATTALTKFLHQVDKRPLYARVAKDNIASICVLEKCGFVIVDEDEGFSYSRNQDVAEYLLQLDK